MATQNQGKLSDRMLDNVNIPGKAVVKLLSGSEADDGINDYCCIEGGATCYYGDDDGI